MLQNEPVAAFRRSKSLKELIGSNEIEYNKVKIHHNISKKDKCSPCSVNNKTLCCKQVISSSTFRRQWTNKSYTTFHEVNCSSTHVIYLMECTLCKKQYVGKWETCFNIRLNNHRKDVKKPDAILVCRHFQERNLVFNKHAKFIIIDKLIKCHQIKRHFTPKIDWKRKFLDSNDGNATPKRTESRA